MAPPLRLLLRSATTAGTAAAAPASRFLLRLCLLLLALAPACAQDEVEAGELREKGTGAAVVSVESPDDVFPRQYSKERGTVVLPVNPHWLGPSVRLTFRGSGFFDGMRFTLQKTNETQCGDMYNLDRNASSVLNGTTPGGVNATEPNFGGFDFGGLRNPLSPDGVSADGTEANYTLPTGSAYLASAVEGFVFCFEPPPTPVNTTVYTPRHRLFSNNTTPTLTETATDPWGGWVDYTIDSGLGFGLFEIRDFSGTSGAALQANNGTAFGGADLLDKPPYDVAFADTTSRYSVRAFVPGGAAAWGGGPTEGQLLYAALSEDHGCGRVLTPEGWSSLGSVRTFVEEPLVIRPSVYANSSDDYSMRLALPESGRWVRSADGNATMRLCVKAYATHPLFHPVELTESEALYGRRFVAAFRTVTSVTLAAHLGEALAPVWDDPFRPLPRHPNASHLLNDRDGLESNAFPQTPHNNTLRFIAGQRYAVRLSHTGLAGFMRLGISPNATCAGGGGSDGLLEEAAVATPANATGTAEVVLYPTAAYNGARVCLSRVGPFAPPSFDFDLGFRAAAYEIHSVGSRGAAEHAFPFGEEGPQPIYSRGLEPFVRVKFEGGDGVGLFTGDEWPRDACTGDDWGLEGEHQPAFVEPTVVPGGGGGGVNGSVAVTPSPGAPPPPGATFLLNGTVSSARWRTRAFVCVATYPFAHSTYETLPLRVNFTTTFAEAAYTDQVVTPSPGRVYLYAGHAVDVAFRGAGLRPHMRLSLGASGCAEPMTTFVGGTEPAGLLAAAPSGRTAVFHTPDAWVAGPAASAAVVCMSAYGNGTSFPLDTGWRLTVMRLNSINRLTDLVIVYGMSDKVFSVSYENGEVGNQVSFAPDCGAVRKTCQGVAADAGMCSSTDPLSKATIAGCRRNALGDGGLNERRMVASTVPKPGGILFIYNCQSSQHTERLRVCMAPIAGSVFRDTGLRVSFVITVAQIELDSLSVARGGDIKVYRGATPTIKLIGTGLYPYMQLASMPNCTRVPYEQYQDAAFANATWTSWTRPWSFVTSSNNTAHTELQYTPTALSTQGIVTGWSLCMSEFAAFSEYPHDFSVSIGYTFTTVQLLTINDTRHLSLPFGERHHFRLFGHNLLRGMQVRLAAGDCLSSAPTADLCSGWLGGPAAGGCNSVAADPPCPPADLPPEGRDVDGLWMYLTQQSTSQNTEGLLVCVSVWPKGNQAFYDTGLTADILIRFDAVSARGARVRPYETLLLFAGYTDHPGEELPANDPRFGRTATLSLEGRGFREGFRMKLQASCGALNDTEGGAPVAVHPLADPLGLTPARCGAGDTRATLYLTAAQTGAATSQNLEMCFSELARGTAFEARSRLFVGVVSLASVSHSGGPHASLPFGFAGDLVLYGSALAPFAEVRLASQASGGLCGPADPQSTFDASLPLVRVEGQPRCVPSFAAGGGGGGGGCAPYNGVSDLRYEGGTAATLSLGHGHTFRQIENLHVCVSLWGRSGGGGGGRVMPSGPFYETSVTLSTMILLDSVTSYGKTHLPHDPAHSDIYVYTRYPEHTITLHGQGFYDTHRVAFMKDGCGAFNYSKGPTERLGPFAVEPVTGVNQTAQPYNPAVSGAAHSTAFVRLQVPSNLTGLHLCYSVFSANDQRSRNNFSHPMGLRLTSVDLHVDKYPGVLRAEGDPIRFLYGKSERIFLSGANLDPRGSIHNQFLLQLGGDECGAGNVTQGAATPAALTRLDAREPFTQRIVKDVPAVSFPSSVTRQLAHRRLCFSPYKEPYHRFMDTGYRVFLQCADPAVGCSDGTAGICDANATRYHQLTLGCACTFQARTNLSCALASRVPCAAETTCSGHGACEGAGVCRCVPGYYGPACDACRVGVHDLRYTDTLKHAVVQLRTEFSAPGRAVAAAAASTTCAGVVSPAQLPSLGSPRCYWDTPSRLHVLLGYGARPDHFALALDTAGISRFCRDTGGGPSPLVIPHTLPSAAVSPFLLAPEAVGPCDGVVLDASLTHAPGGELEYYFSVDNASATHDAAPVLDDLLRTRPDARFPMVRVPAASLPLGAFRFVLRARSLLSGGEAVAAAVVTKLPSTPGALSVVLPQRSPLLVLDVEATVVLGPVEVSSFGLSNAAAACVGLGFAPPVRKRYAITWSVRWRTRLGDVYPTADGELWVEDLPGGRWARVPLPIEKQDLPTLYLPTRLQGARGVFDTLPVNRTAEVRVDVELFDADTPAAPARATGVATVSVDRRGTALAYFQGGNRTVSSAFRMQVILRIDGGAEVDEPYRTRWWCNATEASGAAAREVPCPAPLSEVVVATADGLDPSTTAGAAAQGMTAYRFLTAPPPGVYLFSIAVYVPRLRATLVALSEIVVEAPPPPGAGGGGGAAATPPLLDVGISPAPAALSSQLLHGGAPATFAFAAMAAPAAGTEYKLLWSVWHSRRTRLALPPSVDVTAPTLTLPRRTLAVGGTYHVRCLAREVDAASGLVRRQAHPSFEATVANPPHGGRLEVLAVPEAGTMLFADGWTVEAGRHPLSYKFSLELYSGPARLEGCRCCLEGQRAPRLSEEAVAAAAAAAAAALGAAEKPPDCEALCAGASCVLLADFAPRSYMPVIVPRTLAADSAVYSVTVADRVGSEARYALSVATVVDDGSGVGGPATPTPPNVEPWMADVDQVALAELEVALNKQDVSSFLLTFAQLTTDMQFFATKSFVRIECFTVTLPITETVSLSETGTLSDSVSLTPNGTVLFDNATSTETATLSAAASSTDTATLPAPPATGQPPGSGGGGGGNTSTQTLPAPRCRSVLPAAGETPLLPLFPKSRPLGFQLTQMLVSARGILPSLSSAGEKARVLDLVVAATAQPAFVNRAGAEAAAAVAERLHGESAYLNAAAPGFSAKLCVLLSQVLRASASNLPDGAGAPATPAPPAPPAGDPPPPTPEEEELAIRRAKKALVRRVRVLLDELTEVEGAGVVLGGEWTLEGGGFRRKCKRMWSPALLSGLQAAVSSPATAGGGGEAKAGTSVLPNTTFTVCGEATAGGSSPAAAAGGAAASAPPACNTTNLTMAVVGAEPFRGSSEESVVAVCITAFPTDLHDYSYGTENVTGDNTVSYAVRTENATDASINDASVVVTLPMDPRLYALVRDRRRGSGGGGDPSSPDAADSGAGNDVWPACYWFDEQPACEAVGAGTGGRAACEATCCFDSSSPGRARECNGCCRWQFVAGGGVDTGRCVPGPRAGRDVYTTEGCEVAGFDERHLYCNCTHLTDFVQGFEVRPTPFSVVRRALPPPDRLLSDLPQVPLPKEPNLVALPQAAVLPVLYCAVLLVSMWRERKYRVMVRERQLGGLVRFPWAASVAGNDAEYIRAIDAAGVARHVRTLSLSVKSVFDGEGSLGKLLGGLKSTHTYLNVLFLEYADNRTAVNKVTALFCGVGACWAALAQLLRDRGSDELTGPSFAALSFACALLVAPVAWVLNYAYSRTPRGRDRSSGEHVRQHQVEKRATLRLAHERVLRGMPGEHTSFYHRGYETVPAPPGSPAGSAGAMLAGGGPPGGGARGGLASPRVPGSAAGCGPQARPLSAEGRAPVRLEGAVSAASSSSTRGGGGGGGGGGYADERVRQPLLPPEEEGGGDGDEGDNSYGSLPPEEEEDEEMVVGGESVGRKKKMKKKKQKKNAKGSGGGGEGENEEEEEEDSYDGEEEGEGDDDDGDDEEAVGRRPLRQQRPPMSPVHPVPPLRPVEDEDFAAGGGGGGSDAFGEDASVAECAAASAAETGSVAAAAAAAAAAEAAAMGAPEVVVSERAAAEIDYVLGSMPAWRAATEAARFLDKAPADLAKRIVRGTAHMPKQRGEAAAGGAAASEEEEEGDDGVEAGGGSDEGSEDEATKKKRRRAAQAAAPVVAAAAAAPAPPPPAAASDAGGSGRERERDVEINVWKQIHEQAAYEVRCGRFLCAAHLFFMADKKAQLNHVRETNVNLPLLIRRALRRVVKLGAQFFRAPAREIQVAIAHEERRTAVWNEAVGVVRGGSGLSEAAALFQQHLSTYSLVSKHALAARRNDVKGWVMHYYQKHRKRREDQRSFEAVWGQAIGGSGGEGGDGDGEDERAYRALAGGLREIDHRYFDLEEEARFRRADVVSEIIRGNYVKAEFMMNRMVPGEAVGCVRSTDAPGVFELAVPEDQVPDEIVRYAQENDLLYLTSRFWVEFYACAAKGVSSGTFQHVYTEQARRILARRDEGGVIGGALGRLIHIPTFLAESDEEEEEYEEEEEEEEEEGVGATGVVGASDDGGGGGGDLELDLDDLYEQFKKRFVGGGRVAAADAAGGPVDDAGVVDDGDDAARSADGGGADGGGGGGEDGGGGGDDGGGGGGGGGVGGRGGGGRIAFERREREIFYARSVPDGFRSQGELEGLGRGTLEDPFCTLAYTFKYLRMVGHPHCTVCLLEGVYPPQVIRGARNCDLTRESGKVRLLGRYAWEPVVTMVNCRNMKVYGLEISHGSVGVDAGESTDVFIFENVMTDVRTGVVNPKFGDIGVPEGTVVDLNFSNYILQSFVPPATLLHYSFNYAIDAVAFLTLSLTIAFTFIHTLDMPNDVLAFYAGACYVSVLWDMLVLQPFYYVILKQQEKCCAMEMWRHRLEKGQRPGYKLDDDVSSGSDFD